MPKQEIGQQEKDANTNLISHGRTSVCECRMKLGEVSGKDLHL